jgi:hypothetical protein
LSTLLDILAGADYWVGAVVAGGLVVAILMFLSRRRTTSSLGPAKLTWESVSGAVAVITFAPLSKWLAGAFGIAPWQGTFAALAIIVAAAAAFQTIRMKVQGE